jgi:hypothetical protein
MNKTTRNKRERRLEADPHLTINVQDGFLLVLFIDPADGSDIFLRNVG